MTKETTKEELNDKRKDIIDKQFKKIIEKERDWKVWQHKGIWCVIARMDMKHLCGYIGLPNKVDLGSHTYEHPWFIRDDDGHYDVDGLQSLDVHGGITWGPEFRIGCPVSQFEIIKPLTWIGFDCNHSCDWTPGSPSGEYRTMDYVKQECNRVVDDYYESLLDTLKTQIEEL